MALKLTKLLPTGVIAEYWKVVQINLNVIGGESHVVVALFKDQAARDSGKWPLSANEYSWNGPQFVFSPDQLDEASPLKIAYAKLKALPEFKEAEDA